MGGYIMQLQNFSVNDGEGIRTIVFMAGCPLRCEWCSNPEGQTLKNRMTHYVETEEVLRELRRQAIFYRASGGGVTFSGGEATAQPEFLAEMVNELYDEGFSLAIETSGCFDFAALRPVLEKMDLIFMDLKHIDPEKHRLFTGVDNRVILDNIAASSRLGVPLVVRIPTIIGVNCNEDDMRGAFAFLRDNAPSASLELLPYHKYGEKKYEELGIKPPREDFATPSAEELSRFEKLAMDEYGINVVSYK